jgi:hypothetical protein
MEKKILMTDEAADLKEVRDLIKKLPAAAKVEIVKGMAMFEAGYKSGFVDGITHERTA